MTTSRLAASVQVTFNVYISEEPEHSSPNGHELGYSHIEVLDFEIQHTDVVESKREYLKGLFHADGIIELDPDNVFEDAITEALNDAVPEYIE